MPSQPVTHSKKSHHNDRQNAANQTTHKDGSSSSTEPVESLSSDRILTDSLVPSGIQKTIEKLRQTLDKHHGNRHLAILQDFPDPDAMSSAWVYKLIANEHNIECDIVYSGIVSHQENITLVKLTGMPIQRWPIEQAKKKDLSIYSGCVLIDNQGTTSNLYSIIKDSGLPIAIVVDHHSWQEDCHAEFADIRTNIRATATIFTQYIQGGLLSLDRTNPIHMKCATALMHGLRSDTNGLRQALEPDFLAAAYLSNFYDPELLNSVLQACRSSSVMDVIERALKHRTIENNFSIAGVGYLHYDDRDAIPQAADFLVTEENVHTAVVYGLVHDEDQDIELITGSLRTHKLTLDPDEFLKEALGKDPQGHYFGGGRPQAGGFEIPVGFLIGFNENKEYAKKKWEMFDLQIKQKLLKLVHPKENIIETD